MTTDGYALRAVAAAGLFLALALALTAVRAPAQPPVQADDDAEDRAERLTLVKRAIQENCLICHDHDMISGQRLTPKQWAAEVEKMVGWGSPLAPEWQPQVAAYLASTYPVDATTPALPRRTLREALDTVRPEPGGSLNPAAARGQALYAANCANCHGPDAQGADLGPNLAERPVLYRWDDYHRLVRDGRGRMPAFATVLKESDEADVLAWLRGRRYTPGVVK